ncbi:MAG: TA0956 family protein [Thermoprotei archaeon]
MTDCVGVTTIFGNGSVSVFCVGKERALEVLSALLPFIREDYIRDLFVELVDKYGKKAVSAEDVTVSTIVIDLLRSKVSVSEPSNIPEVAEYLNSYAPTVGLSVA